MSNAYLSYAYAKANRNEMSVESSLLLSTESIRGGHLEAPIFHVLLGLLMLINFFLTSNGSDVRKPLNHRP